MRREWEWSDRGVELLKRGFLTNYYNETFVKYICVFEKKVLILQPVTKK